MGPDPLFLRAVHEPLELLPAYIPRQILVSREQLSAIRRRLLSSGSAAEKCGLGAQSGMLLIDVNAAPHRLGQKRRMSKQDLIAYHATRSRKELSLGLMADNMAVARSHLELSSLHYARLCELEGRPPRTRPPFVL